MNNVKHCEQTVQQLARCVECFEKFLILLGNYCNSCVKVKNNTQNGASSDPNRNSLESTETEKNLYRLHCSFIQRHRCASLCYTVCFGSARATESSNVQTFFFECIPEKLFKLECIIKNTITSAWNERIISTTWTKPTHHQ